MGLSAVDVGVIWPSGEPDDLDAFTARIYRLTGLAIGSVPTGIDWLAVFACIDIGVFGRGWCLA
ncbi:MAG: hypothetical protein GXP43_02140 [bacterium]|nr:hypothetical protein [bacterium]